MSDWHLALKDCQEKYKTYNWIHAYPNACCEVIALYYGNGDYSRTLHIVTMCGVDVDCNAGMIMQYWQSNRECVSFQRS